MNNLPRLSIAGMLVSTCTKQELLQFLQTRIASHTQTFVVTAYSEFLYTALRKPEYLTIFNSADCILADGVGILWAEHFLRQPFVSKSFIGQIFEAYLQVAWTGAQILFSPHSLYTHIPEKIPGSDLIWDMSQLAQSINASIFILGGFGDTPARVGTILTKRFPGLRIVGTSNKGPNDPEVLEAVRRARPDMLFVAYGPLRQERFIADHIASLPVSVAIGLGGTFDYLVGNVTAPPRFIRSIGLEWFFRLITQPKRLVRIKHATWDLVRMLVRYKVFNARGYRQNVVCVVFNTEGKVLIAKKSFRELVAARVPKELRADPVWQFPQGGVDRHETHKDAAIRELYEETGIRSAEFITFSKSLHQYTWNNAMRPLVFDRYFIINRFRAKGQEQHIAYFRFQGQISEIHLDTRELSEWQWVKPEDLHTIIQKERLPVVEILQNDLKAGLVP